MKHNSILYDFIHVRHVRKCSRKNRDIYASIHKSNSVGIWNLFLFEMNRNDYRDGYAIWLHACLMRFYCYLNLCIYFAQNEKSVWPQNTWLYFFVSNLHETNAELFNILANQFERNTFHYIPPYIYHYQPALGWYWTSAGIILTRSIILASKLITCRVLTFSCLRRLLKKKIGPGDIIWYSIDT